MKFVCAYGQSVDSGKYTCRTCDRNCPAGQLSLFFEPGEWIENIEIIETLRLYPTCVLYRARRDKKTVLLKIAHRGYEEPLKREADFLAHFPKHPSTLVLLPTAEGQMYGKLTVQGETKYYTLYENVDGQWLDDLLLKNPRPERSIAGWLVIALAGIVSVVHNNKHLWPLNMAPQNILIQIDKTKPYVWRPIITDLSGPFLSANWFTTHGIPAYLAPEQLRGESATPRTDLYSLGLILYELLFGQPAIAFKLHSDSAVRSAVHEGFLIPVLPELAPSILDVLRLATDKTSANRPTDIRAFAKPLRQAFGDVPKMPQRFTLGPKLVIGAVVFLLIIAIIVLLITLL